MTRRQVAIEKAYKLINVPIDPNLKLPFELSEIADYSTAEPGEPVKWFGSRDDDTDDIYSANANGTITYHKLTNKIPVALTFQGLQSKLETILIDEIMNSEDSNALADKKDGIIRSMDKMEAYRIFNAILTIASQEVVFVSGTDLVDNITKMVQLAQKYGTDNILICGENVYKKYQTYDKDNVSTFQYNLRIKELLENLNISKVIHCVGTLNGSTPILADGSAILVARNSHLAKGRPISLCRRKFSEQIAQMTGVTGTPERLVEEVHNPQIINGDNGNTLGFGVLGYESLIEVVTNYRAVCWSVKLF